MESDEKWSKIREDLRVIKETCSESKDVDLNNMSSVIDLLLLSTYMPDHLHNLYDIIDQHLADVLGGKN